MERKFKILVFPCGSEIGLEIHRSLKFSAHIELYGASSVEDHGTFVFENYITGLPFFDDPKFISELNKIINTYQIDVIYPAMDGVMAELGENVNKIDCKIIGSSPETSSICLSKKRTYEHLNGIVDLADMYSSLDEVSQFPVFMKPDVGYGSRGAKVINNHNEGEQHLEAFPSSIVLENLPGSEYTIDCFTNKNGKLLFSGGRKRNRIQNGISVNTSPVSENEQFNKIAQKINEAMEFQGAWFFQLKEDALGNLKLLEVASRLGGSSSLYRNLGVNFALLSIFNTFNLPVEILLNDYAIEMDRALDNKFKLAIKYDTAYIDFDDCLLLGENINTQLVSFLFQALNEKVRLVLITRHALHIDESLKKYRLAGIFDEVIHITNKEPKYKYMKAEAAIFIDDSFAERKAVKDELKIPVFSPDTIESLLK
jgi:hypothetical protein